MYCIVKQSENHSYSIKIEWINKIIQIIQISIRKM